MAFTGPMLLTNMSVWITVGLTAKKHKEIGDEELSILQGVHQFLSVSSWHVVVIIIEELTVGKSEKTNLPLTLGAKGVFTPKSPTWAAFTYTWQV